MENETLGGAYFVLRNDADKEAGKVAGFFEGNVQAAVIGTTVMVVLVLWALHHFVK